ncbi:MAG: methylated-DNA--[protein]-cysteine S-methyltransferase [Candidatus Sumerlaeaceae bacterium]|nr:methylated-DNA--[protein]-cysteine S-methyltransferase [Candidatus Sumerlaeaceae bacterium]
MIPNHHAMQSDFVEVDRTLPVYRALSYFQLENSIIAVNLAGTESGLLECRISGTPLDVIPSETNTGYPISLLDRAALELAEYFQGKRMRFSVPLSPEGTEFQKQVWKAACQIPYGQVRSYWWVAVRMGNPHAARAVGGALRENPLAIFIPCHRVVRQDGTLGGFAPGIEWKQLLLSHEARFKDELYKTWWASHLT